MTISAKDRRQLRIDRLVLRVERQRKLVEEQRRAGRNTLVTESALIAMEDSLRVLKGVIRR
jgi:hypothetical protein